MDLWDTQRMCLQAHAENLHAQSYQTVSQPAHKQVAAKAQSLATHAQSLEAQAEAQNLQASKPSYPLSTELILYLMVDT